MKRLLVFGALITSMTFVNANIGPAGFKDYVNYYFVETGTFGGEAIAKALAVGFQEARSIEFVPVSFRDGQKRFAGYKNVKLWHGDSALLLWDMIKDITKPITFWLDAHVYPPQTHGKNCPLIEELEQIKRHPIKTHTILIDDMHCAGTAAFDGLTREDLIAKILEINPNYRVTYIDGGNEGEVKDNIMVAQVPSN